MDKRYTNKNVVRLDKVMAGAVMKWVEEYMLTPEGYADSLKGLKPILSDAVRLIIAHHLTAKPKE